MMNHRDKTKEELIIEFKKLQQRYNSLKESYDIDITESKQKEEVLQKLKKAVDNSGEIIFLTDTEGIFTFVNPAFTSIYGYTADEIVGKVTPRILKSGLMEMNYYKLYWGTLISGKEVRCELINKRKDGTLINIDGTSNPIFDEKKNIIGFLEIQRDITERKLAEETLRSSEEHYRFSLEITGQIGWSIPPDGLVEDMPLWRQYSGQSIEEVKGWKWLDSVHPDDREHTNKVWVNAIAQKCKYETEYRIRRVDGVYRYFMVRGIPLFNTDGTVREWAGTCIDITERKQAEQELIEAKEHAEESDHLKTSFLNNISHEIRTPFNGILGFLSLIQEEDLTDSERDEYISIINKSAYRLMKTINDIVEISQIQAGQMKLSVSETNIHKLTSGVYKHFKTDAESKGLKFCINNDLPINIEYIFTDGIKLNIILTILIDNAIKFTETGSIEFGIRLVDKVDEQAVKKHSRASLQFSVKDTGIGIPENKLLAIFERFMQADGSNTRQFEGSGLGLSIVKAYVEMLGGKIWVESEQGIGSTFYFTIPYNRESQSDTNKPNIKSADYSKYHVVPEVTSLKILIVEDDESNLKLITVTVKTFCNKILKAKTGIEAVEACRNNPDIDLILMDIKMPEMDGYEATRQIRQFNTEVLIIAQTAFALTGDREKALAAGCNDYISKPYGKSLLMSLIEKHFKNSTIN